MAEPAVLRRMLGFGLLGVAAVTALAPGIALVRATTGHDWYAAGKLTAVEAAITVGFNRTAPVVDYRRWNGRAARMSRDEMYWNGEALAARDRILETALHHALPGAGIGGAVLLTTMLGAAGRLPRGRLALSAVPEADLAQIADPDGAVNLVQPAQRDRAAPDGGDGRRGLAAAPPERAASEGGDAAAGPDSEGGRPRRYGRWA